MLHTQSCISENPTDESDCKTTTLPQEFVLARAIVGKAEVSEAQNTLPVPNVLSNKINNASISSGLTTCFRVEKLALNTMQ